MVSGRDRVGRAGYFCEVPRVFARKQAFFRVDEEMCLEGFFNKEGFYTMSNFLKSLFGAKKAAKVAKSKMQTRRLELIGLEERVTPAVTATGAGTVLGLITTAGENLTSVVANADGTLTVSATAADGTTPVAVAATSGQTTSVQVGTTNVYTVTFITGNVNTVTALTLTGDAVGNQDFTIAGINSTAYSANFGLSVDMGADATGIDALNFTTGTVTLKGTGALVNTNIDAITIAAAGDITAATGAVGISATTISTAGDVTTTSGAIGYTGAVTLSGNVATTSTLAGGNLSITGTLALGANNFTANQGLGNVTTISGGVISGSGALSLTGAAVTTVGAISTTGSVTAVATTGDLTFSAAVAAASVNAKSTTGDVKFLNTVTTGLLGNFTSEATLATKATQIAALVTVGAGANALVTGNLISNATTAAAITTSNVGSITITGNVDASVAGNDLALTAATGAVTITGNVGSGSIAFGDLNANGTGSFLASGTVVANNINIGQSTPFTTSVTFAKAVTANVLLITDTGINVDAGVSGTITFSDAITVALGTGATATAATSAADVFITSTSGAISVVGNITGLDSVTVQSTSGSITLSGAVTTSGTNDSGSGEFGDILIGTGTAGNVLLSGNISTTGLGDIELDNEGTGTLTINGNVSTAAVNQTNGPNGDIFIGADSTSTATGGSSIIINGTVTTTGTVAGDIFIGVNGGSVAVNKAVTAGLTGNVVFITTAATDAITIASGANITAGDSVGDFGAGILNLGANITAGTAAAPTTLGIFLDAASINLTGAVSLKTGGTGNGADIGLANVNGAQNLTLESTDQIVLGSVGQTTALNTVTVTNSAGVTVTGNFNGSVVVTDTTGVVAFTGTNTTISKLTTALKGYSVNFGDSSTDTTVLSGAPVFLNTGGVSFQGTTSLITGATITGNVTSTVALANTIVSGGAFNIGAAANTGVVTIADGTQLILNSAVASTIANPIAISGATGTLGLLGTGTLTLSADSLTGTTGDSISVINGTLNVTGKIANATTATSGTITGAGGTIGALNVNTGTVAPGGTLNTGAVTLNAATNYSAAVLTTTTAANLKTASAINLGGATLSLSSVAAGLAVNNTFTIIDNTAVSGLVTGTFANQPEGSSISAKDTAGNTVTFIVSYIGGTNANDVTLKVSSITSATPTPTAPAQPMVAGQPALNKFTAVGADAGGGPLVTITFQNGTFVSFFAYASTFTGGVRVALGDVNGDGSTDVITGAGPGGGPQVNVYNVNNATGAVSLQKSFFAFSAPSFTGGVYVAAGNTNGDAFADVIVGAGATGGSRVQVYAGSATGVVTTSTLNDFFAYSPAFTGGVVVAAGQRDAVAGDEIITAPASGGGYNIKSFNANGTGNNPTVVDNFFAFNNTTSVGGLSLAVGLLNSGSIADLIVGTTNGGYGVIVDSATAGIAGVPFAGFTGAIRAGVAEDANGQDFAVALAGPTGAPRISVFSVGATALTQTDSLFVMNTGFTGGLFGTPTLPATIVVA